MASKRSFQTLLNTTRVAYTNRLINPARARVRSTLPSISPIWTNSPLQQRIRWKSTTSSTQPETNNPGSKTVVNQEDQEDVGLIDNSAPSKGQPIGKIEQRLSLTFTCTVPDCGKRSSHEFSKKSYEKGIVLVQCPGCKNRHLIADHLGWFKESTEDGKLKTVEDLVKARGEQVRRGVATGRGAGVIAPDGTVSEGDLEFVLDDEEGTKK